MKRFLRLSAHSASDEPRSRRLFADTQHGDPVRNLDTHKHIG